MSQNMVFSKAFSEKMVVGKLAKRKIKIPNFDNSALIEGYLKTVFGRCMNPWM